MEIVNLIVIIVIGLGACVSFAMQLRTYIRTAMAENKFDDIIKIALDLIPEAEDKFSTGAERKEYVMSNIKSISATMNGKVDLDKISDMIDAIVAMSKKVNVKKK